MKRTRLLLASFSVLALAACSPAGTGTNTDTTTGDESMNSSMDMSSSPYLDQGSASSDGVTLDVNSSNAMTQSSAAMSKSKSSAAASKQAAAPRVITVNVTNWTFSPATITAKKGEKVTLKLVGGEGIHGFGVPGLGINVRVEPGQSVMVDLPTSTTGTFNAMCTIPCGPGHREMQQTIVIS